MHWATMPEAPVHEDSDLGADEHHIGAPARARQSRINAVTKPKRPQR